MTVKSFLQAFDKDNKTEQENVFIKRIFSGGDRSFAFTTPNNSDSYDSRTVEYVIYFFFRCQLP